MSRVGSQMIVIALMSMCDSVPFEYSLANLGDSLVKYDVPGNRKKGFEGSLVPPVSPSMNINPKRRPAYNRRSGDHGYSAGARRQYYVKD